MSKSLFIAEKPSVAKEFAKALKETFKSGDGFMESQSYVVTWCVGHLVAMSYPEKYDPSLKKWSLDTLPFIPKVYLYEVISGVKKQFGIVKKQLTREDVDTIFVCTDSGREGEYIYRLVREEAGVKNKTEKRVWIDSQTEEEIIRGIKTAGPISEYDNIAASAYLRAKEDYLMGINFSRAMSLIYGQTIASAIGERYIPVAMGRVMTCVLGMIVKREREIREFVPLPFYRLNAHTQAGFNAEWKVNEKSLYAGSNRLYKDNGFLEKEDACNAAEKIAADSGVAVTFTAKEKNSKGNEDADEGNGNAEKIKDHGIADEHSEVSIPAIVEKVEKKKETVKPPLLYNLAELQNDCAKIFKINPENTLKIAQELYEKKLTTYPRTDARVLSGAVCKELEKNIKGLTSYAAAGSFAKEVLENGSYKDVGKSRYCDDKKITDHYAIIPTGAGLNNLGSLSDTAAKVYELIVRRFLSVFYPAAEYRKINMVLSISVGANGENKETFTAGFKALVDEGFMKVAKTSFDNRKEKSGDGVLPPEVEKIKKGDITGIDLLEIKEGETSPPKRYNSGSMILAMENAGQLIEDEELRAQIKGSGIGTSATRSGILEKLNKNKYIKTNNKTQILTPTFLGEMIYDATRLSLHHLLSPELTASWEKGLSMVAEGEITPEEYMEKLEGFVKRRTKGVVETNNRQGLYAAIQNLKSVYK